MITSMKIAALRAESAFKSKIKPFKVQHVRQRIPDLESLHLKSASWFKKETPLSAPSFKHKFLRRGTKDDYEHVGTFQEAIAPIIVLAQIFSLLPVRGITKKSAHEIEFLWISGRTVYAVITIICFGLCSAISILATRGHFNFNNIETIIFYTSIFCIAALFLNLGRKWPKLMQQWKHVERQLPPLRTESQKSHLAHRIKMITLFASMCSLLEHILSMLSIIYYVSNCPSIPNHPIDSFLEASFSQYFSFFAYNPAMGIVGKILNVLSTFAWSFNDMFVMVISVAISSRFRQLNDHMLTMVKSPITVKEIAWIRSRTNYRNLCRLCQAVDNAISPITFLCFANNLFFICGKILKSIQKKPSISQTIYFWFSLFFLIGRTFVLSQMTADINDEAKRPLRIFRLVKRENWYPELKRFSDEVATDVVALSGMKLFQLTRSILLPVAGTIVTYELVLLQFYEGQEIADCIK